MIRLTSASLGALLAASLATACAPVTPTEPNAAVANAKPGGGGGVSGPLGQRLGATAGSKAYAVNASYAVGRDGAGTATAWNAAGASLVLPVGSSASAIASGINAAGTIVGEAGPSAVVWEPSGVGTWATALPLPVPAGSWTRTRALAINDLGQVAGTGTRSDQLSFALRWTPAPGGYLVEVSPAPGADYEFVGNAIANGTGWVTGWVRRTVNGAVAKDGFLWTAAGTFRLLGRLDGAATEGRGINAAGRVVGWSASAPKGGDSSPVTWTCTETACTAPAALPAFYRNLNYAFSIDDAGEIVGTSGLDAILYTRCGTTVVLHPPAGWHQSYGWAISGDGSAAAGYSFSDSGVLQATRWLLPAPAC